MQCTSSGGSTLEEIASEIRSLERAYVTRGGGDPNLLDQFRELLAAVEQMRLARQNQQQARARPRGAQHLFLQNTPKYLLLTIHSSPYTYVN